MKPSEYQTPFIEGNNSILSPAPLKKGDKIGIVSPASAVKEGYVLDAMERIKERGYMPILMEHAIHHENGSFAATKEARLADILKAIEDPEIKAILCARGGYGCCQLLSDIPFTIVAKNPKWIIGFSDVSALLALWYHSGIASIHGPMAKHLATMPYDDKCTEYLFHILENGGKFDYCIPGNKYNRQGKAKGILRGGNLAVLNDLSYTPYDILDIKEKEDIILFIEDISEPIYKVNRILWRLLLSGTLENVKGIIFGQFTEYSPDRNFQTMEDMINEFINQNASMPQIPMVFDFPTGHTDLNFPLTEGALVELDVTEKEVRLFTI